MKIIQLMTMSLFHTRCGRVLGHMVQPQPIHRIALVADAWSRTYRSRAVTFSRTHGVQRSRNGIRIVPDQVAASWPADHQLPQIADRQPARALDDALAGITARYGDRTAKFVAMQLEYPSTEIGLRERPPR